MAGGTDAQQLVEVLMEKEEECRHKDQAIQSLDQQLYDLGMKLQSVEHERNTLKVSLGLLMM